MVEKAGPGDARQARASAKFEERASRRARPSRTPRRSCCVEREEDRSAVPAGACVSEWSVRCWKSLFPHSANSDTHDFEESTPIRLSRRPGTQMKALPAASGADSDDGRRPNARPCERAGGSDKYRPRTCRRDARGRRAWRPPAHEAELSRLPPRACRRASRVNSRSSLVRGSVSG